MKGETSGTLVHIGVTGTEVRDAQPEVQRDRVERGWQEIGHREPVPRVPLLLFPNLKASGKRSTPEEIQRKRWRRLLFSKIRDPPK